MEYANTFSLDFPVELWRPFAQDRPSVRCSSGYLIYLQGTEATCFYYLKKGKVKSFIQSEDGAERTLNLYQQGSIFGEASFFDELPRVSSPPVRSSPSTGSRSRRNLPGIQAWPCPC